MDLINFRMFFAKIFSTLIVTVIVASGSDFLLRDPIRTLTNETLKFPNSIDPKMMTEESQIEIEKRSTTIARSVSKTIRESSGGEIILALSELTHPDTSGDTKQTEAAEEVKKTLEIDKLKELKAIKDAKILSNVGLVIFEFDEGAEEENIADTVMNIWNKHRSVWILEPSENVEMRENFLEQTDKGKVDTSDLWGQIQNGLKESTILNVLREFEDAVAKDEKIQQSFSKYVSSTVDVLRDALKRVVPLREVDNILNTAREKFKTEIGTKYADLFDRITSEVNKKTYEDNLRNVDVPNDRLFARQWSLHNDQRGEIDIEALSAWDFIDKKYKDRFSKDLGIVIAIIDTGIDVDHPDLRNSMWINEGEIAGNGIDDDGNGYIDDIFGWNFDENSNNILDYNGHGTHVAGIIAAERNNAEGISGINSNIKLMALKFRNRTSQVIQAIDYSLKMGAKISSNSWGYNNSNATLKLVMEKTSQRGQLFVCAVDNKGMDNTSFPDFPPNWGYDSRTRKGLNNILRVASISRRGIRDSTSNYGRYNVDIFAPGKDIVSTVPKKTYNDYYGFKSGTSMATPHVSAVAGTLMMLNPDLGAEELKEIIMSTVTKNEHVDDEVISGGILNAHDALLRVAGSNSQTTERTTTETEKPVFSGTNILFDIFNLFRIPY